MYRRGNPADAKAVYESGQTLLTYRVGVTNLKERSPMTGVYGGTPTNNTPQVDKAFPIFFPVHDTAGVDPEAFQSFLNFSVGNAKTTWEVMEHVAMAGIPSASALDNKQNTGGKRAASLLEFTTTENLAKEKIHLGGSLFGSAPPLHNGTVTKYKSGLSKNYQDRLPGCFRMLTRNLTTEMLGVNHARAMKKIATPGGFDRQSADWRKHHNYAFHKGREILAIEWLFLAEITAARAWVPAGNAATVVNRLRTADLNDAREFFNPTSGAAGATRIDPPTQAVLTPQEIIATLVATAGEMGLLSSPNKPNSGKPAKLITDILASIMGLGSQYGVARQLDIGSFTKGFPKPERDLLLAALNDVDLDRTSGITHHVATIQNMRRGIALQSCTEGPFAFLTMP